MKLKGIDGGPHKQWSMWFNSTQREEPYQVLTSSDERRNTFSLRSRETGGAWLSSARVVRCWVKSRNERNPYCQLPSFSWELWRDCRGQHGGRWGRRQIIMPLMSWATHVLQWSVQREAKRRRGANPQKAGPSSDCGLQPAHMKLELLVIANQNVAVNTFPGLVHTARHTMGVGYARSQ